MKKLNGLRQMISLILCIVISCMCFVTPVFAIENFKSEKPMLHYQFSGDNVYELSEEQFQEIYTCNNFSEVVTRDNLQPINESTVGSIYDTCEISTVSVARTAGYWEIPSNEIRPGYKANYTQANNGSFIVNDGETLYYQLTPDRNCTLTVGCTGTIVKSISPYIDLSKVGGVTIGIEDAGSYRFYAANDTIYNDFTITVYGSIAIS